jgi:hypothetical protein
MTAAVVPMRPRAIDALQPAMREIEQHPECGLIIDSASGRAKVWPRQCAVPPGWYRFSINVKSPRNPS